MGRPRNIANLYNPPKSNTSFSEGHKSKGILDDNAVRKAISLKQGTIEHTPTNPKDIVNKEYADGNFLKLDASNDPVTEDLTLNKNLTINNPAIINTDAVLEFGLFFYDNPNFTANSIDGSMTLNNVTKFLIAGTGDFMLGGDLFVDGYIYVGDNDAGNDHFLTWRRVVGETSSDSNLHFDWTNSRFEFDDDLYANGEIIANGTTRILSTSENWTTSGWGKALELETADVMIWKVGNGISWGMAGNSDGNFYMGKSTSDDATAAFETYTKYEGASNIVSYGGRLRTGSNLSLNYDGPDGTSIIYFYEGSSETGKSLRWNNSSNNFEFNDDLILTGSLVAGLSVTADDNFYVNLSGPDRDSHIYFYENSSAVGAVFMWDDSETAFDLSHGITINGDTIFKGEGSGLPFGSFYGDGLAQTFAANNTYTRVADTICSVGELNLTTYTDAGTTLTISKAGRYKIDWDLSAESHGGAADVIDAGIMIDSTNTLQAAGKNHHQVRAANSEVSLSGTAIIDCPNGTEVIGVGFGSVGNFTIHIHSVNLTIIQVGGT